MLGVLGVLATAVRRTRAAASRREALLADNAGGTNGGRWPRLGEVDLETLGVRVPQAADCSKRAQLPYVTRALDKQLDDDLRNNRFVLVLGPAACGKSRSTVEMARARFADRPALIPRRSQGALSRLVDARAIPAGAVVWLDQLEEHLQLGVDAAILQRILDLPEVQLVATMRAAAYDLFKPAWGVRPPGREAVDLAEQVQYTGWDDLDRSEAIRRLVDFPRIVAALNRGTGLSDFLSAGPELIDRLSKGNPPPGGLAITCAAADWYRAGLSRPAPLDLVRRLYPYYLPEDDAALLDQFERWLEWTTEPVAEGARLITCRTDLTGLTVARPGHL